MFISIEGTEGVGKSTFIQGISAYLQSKGYETVCCREPGGTELAEKIRSILVTPHEEILSLDAELLLMYASRSQNTHENILPALKNNLIPISDRYFDSSRAYQFYGRGLPLEKIDALEKNFVVVKPDITFWLDAPVEIGLSRAVARGKLDRFESERVGFFERVRNGYAEIQKNEPNRIKRLDATKSVDEILSLAVRELNQIGY